MKTSMPSATARCCSGAEQLEAGAVADVGEAGVAVAAEVALQDPAVGRAVEERPPLLELEDRGRAPPARAAAAMRQLFSILPPRIVSRKCTCQLSSGQTLPSAAATPPSAITVWALPRSDLQTTAVRAPELAWPRSRRAARRRRRR